MQIDLTIDSEPEDGGAAPPQPPKGKDYGPRATDWVFTINNPSEEDIAWIKSGVKKYAYIIMQGEIGENGTPHLQGFVQMKDRKRLSWMKQHFCKGGHYEVRKGTVEQAKKYPEKDETYSPDVCPRFEHGEAVMPKKRGPKETATSKLAKKIMDGEVNDAREAMLADPAMYLRSRSNILGMINDVKSTKTRTGHQLYIFYGDSGSGKTYTAKNYLEKHYPGQWEQCSVDLSDYVQLGSPKAVLIEEFSGNIEMNLFKQLFDPDATKPKIKQRFFNGVYAAELTIITSNRHPGSWYQFKSEADVKAIYRRIHGCYEHQGEFVEDFDEDVKVIKHACGEKGIPQWFKDVAWSHKSSSFVE